jgi:hypothetical protein
MKRVVSPRDLRVGLGYVFQRWRCVWTGIVFNFWIRYTHRRYTIKAVDLVRLQAFS